MAAVFSLVVVAAIGLIVTRVATVALILTGMSEDAARFQARSALTGTGFTTSEAESVVRDPARRRIVGMLMLASGAGAVSGVGALILSFAGVDSATAGIGRAVVLIAALTGLVWLSRREPVDRFLRRVIERFLRRWTSIDARDYAELLHVSGDWRIAQVAVAPGTWLTAGPLEDLQLPAEGVAVLGLDRAGQWIGAPGRNVHLEPGDIVVLYGKRAVLNDVKERALGRRGVVESARSRRRYAAECEEEEPGGEVEATRRDGRAPDARPLEQKAE